MYRLHRHSLHHVLFAPPFITPCTVCTAIHYTMYRSHRHSLHREMRESFALFLHHHSVMNISMSTRLSHSMSHLPIILYYTDIASTTSFQTTTRAAVFHIRVKLKSSVFNSFSNTVKDVNDGLKLIFAFIALYCLSNRGL